MQSELNPTPAQSLGKQNRELAIILGKDYVISPDIIIAREAVTDEEINAQGKIINSS